MSNALTGYHVRTVVLWRDAPRHCECGRVGSQWIAHLYLEGIIVAECACDLLSPMLHRAQHWRAAVKNDESCASLRIQLQAENPDY